ncbi:hypothetical protein B0H14DRAFT_2346933 [Mycena olivaceomarginata]|nr:hypothetical protein B0H14DRAFT_2346933 [Mycena olivaceomarginata]
MPPRFTLLLFVPLFVCHWALATNPFTQYAVDFPDPNYVTAGQFGAKFGGAEATIVAWADEMASYGPWSVTNKSVVAPSGDKHDYMSWAPYQWPDCSNVHNTTVLSPSDIRKLCNYVFRDGQVNPDRNTIQDSQSFSNLSDAVLYNSIAAMLQNKSSSVYSQNMGACKNSRIGAAGAVNWTQGYFSGIFQGQVNSTGDQVRFRQSSRLPCSNQSQPQEASRTRPYHYRNFNIAGMTVRVCDNYSLHLSENPFTRRTRASSPMQIPP